MSTSTTENNNKAAQIAAALGADWRAQEANGDHHHLIRDDGLRLWLSSPDWHTDKRYHVSLSLSNEAAGIGTIWENNERVTCDSIGISPDKSAEKIAADITRRLLPQAEKLYRLAMEKVDYNKREHTARTERMETIAEASGGKAKYQWSGDNRTGAPDKTKPCFTVSLGGSSNNWGRHGYGEVQINSGLTEATVNITLTSVPFAMAQEVCKFLRDNFYAKTTLPS